MKTEKICGLPKRGDYAAEIKRLRKLASKSARKDRPDRIAPNEISMCVTVFQPRGFDNSGGSLSNRHIRELVRAIKASPAGDLDPVLVMPLGSVWMLVEGHHRLAAYRSLGRSEPVPVEVFEGGLDAAIEASIERNNKNRLGMQLSDRLDAAWKLANVFATIGTQVRYRSTALRIAQIAGISEKTVRRMRSAREKLTGIMTLDDFSGSIRQYADETIAAMRWHEADKLSKGEKLPERVTDYDMSKAIKRYADGLRIHFGPTWPRQAEAFAKALLEVSENGAGKVHYSLSFELGLDHHEEIDL
jgi:hypothetical protein